MDASRLVAPSRQGDKFHYYWAARRALGLLEHGTEFVAMTIEGRSDPDLAAGAAGDEIIDIAEYWGAETPADATRIVYSQLKHSTFRTDKAWVASGLRDVFAKFASIYEERRASGIEANLAFRIVTNRPVAPSVRTALTRIIAGKPDNVTTRALRSYLKLPKAHVPDFLTRIEINDTEVNALHQVDQLRRETGTFVAAASTEVMLRLKEEMTELAASTERRSLRRDDILLIFGVFEDDLLPAPNLIERPDHILEREAYIAVLKDILEGASTHVVHAAGGVGKSSFAAWLDDAVDERDVVIVFDCFGGGSYRELSKARHDHRGLVQIANEIAGARLGDPLIPVKGADSADYLKAFMSRLNGAAGIVGQSGGRLVLVVDAADNAVMAADADPGSRAFPIALLRETFPSNVRLIATARTERVDKLELDPGIAKHELSGFDEKETKAFLALTYSAVTTAEADEFRALSWGNPRVQATAVRSADTVAGAVQRVGSLELTDAETAFDALLADGLARLKFDHGSDSASIDAVCEVLACLRPVIRIDTLAELADVPPAFVESLLSDFPAPLRRVGDAIHFRDEPTETFFREQLKPTPAKLEDLIARIEPLTATNYYLASSLPQLLWEVGRYEHLIALALSTAALPASSDTEARQVEEARAQFALRAALSGRHWVDSARLALRIGRLGEASGVRDRLIAENADLAGRSLDQDFVDRITGNRYLALGQPGFNLAREGVMLAMRPETIALAPSRLRSAHGWMVAATSRRDHHVKISDLADLVYGIARTKGPPAAAQFMSRFSTRAVFPIARIVAARLIDAGRTDVVEEFGTIGANRMVALACAHELWDSDLPISPPFGEALVKMLRSSRTKRFGITDRDDEELELRVVLSAVCLTLPHGLPAGTARRLLEDRLAGVRMSYLGDWGLRDRHIIALANAVLRRLDGQELGPDDLADEKLRETLHHEHTSDNEAQHYRRNVRPAIPWMNEWARAIVDSGPFALDDSLVAQLGKPVGSWQEQRVLANWMLRAMTGLARRDPRIRDKVAAWVEQSQKLLGSTELVRRARSLAHDTAAASVALELFSMLETRTRSGVDGAEYRATLFCTMARAVWAMDEERARVYFLEALDSADLVGDEAHTQWATVLALTEIALAEPDTMITRILPLAHAAEALRRTEVAQIDFGRVTQLIGRASVEAALKVASQWRDRNVDSIEITLGGLLHYEDAPLHDSWAARLALRPIVDRGSIGQLALRAADDGGDAEALYAFAVTMMHRNGLHPGNDADLRHLGERLGHQLQPRATASLERESDTRSSTLWAGPPRKDDRDRRRLRVLKALRTISLTTAEAITDAIASATWENGLNHADILQIPFEAERQRDLAAFISAFAEAGLLAAHEVRGVLERLANMDLPIAARRAARDAARGFAKRFALEISTKSYDPINLPALSKLADKPESDIRAEAFHRLADLDPALGVDDAYALATNLASLVGPDGAARILDDALQQFDAIVQTAAEAIQPIAITAEDMSDERGLAALLWSALGDPTTDTRWRAAHAARGILAAGPDGLVREFAARAGAGDPGEYADPALQFYLRDADHFLLLALDADCATTDPARFALFTDFLTRVNAREQHMLLSPLSARLLEHIGAAVPNPWEPLPAKQLAWSERKRRKESKYREQDTPYRFDWDFRENVLESLAYSMDLSPKKVERLTSDIVTETWQHSTRGAIVDDLRHQRGDFQGRDTHDRYAAPHIVDLDYYLAFHAAMVAGAELVQTHPPILEEETSVDELTEWARRFQVSPPPDGWLADRRTAAPSRAGVFGTADAVTWRWGVRADDFLPYLIDEAGWINVWGRYSIIEHSRDETIKISTLLAEENTALALVRSLQIDRGSYDFYIPAEQRFEDQDEVEERASVERFTLRPWIRLDERDRTLDWGDPFAAELPHPPPRPGTAIQKHVSLAGRTPIETWKDATGEDVLLGEAWSSGSDRGGNSHNGSRLRARADWLDAYMRAEGKSLVAVVTIDRDLRGYERDRHKLDEMGYISDYFRVFEYRPGAGWLDHRGRSQPG